MVHIFKGAFPLVTVLVLAATQLPPLPAVQAPTEGTVSGRVSSLAGAPLPNIIVHLQRTRYSEDGVRELRAVARAVTDDRGEYRLFSVSPGRYYLSAGSPPPLPILPQEFIDRGVPAATQNPATRYGTVYYPTAVDPSGAALIEVQAGVESRGLDLALTVQPTFQIRGRVIDSTTGLPPPPGWQVNFTVLPRGTVGTRADILLSSYSDGSFVFPEVAAGDYWVIARRMAPSGAILFARLPIRVTNSDIDNVVLAFEPLFSISARLAIEGDEPLESLPGTAGIVVWLAPPKGPLGRALGTESWAASVRDGIISFENVAPGEYYVAIGTNLPPGTYVKTVRFAGKDVFNQAVSLTGPTLDSFTILLSTKAGRVDGTVTDRSGKPVADAKVVLVPDSRERVDLYKSEQSSPDGHFRFGGIPPGDYKVFAWTWNKLEPYAYFDPEVLREAEANAVAVHISEASSQKVQVRSN
jgi:hypothetical protein